MHNAFENLMSYVAARNHGAQQRHRPSVCERLGPEKSGVLQRRHHAVLIAVAKVPSLCRAFGWPNGSRELLRRAVLD